MWRIIIKLITLNLVESKLHGLAQAFAVFLEHRSNVLAVNVAFEWERVFKSLIAIVVITIAMILSLFIGFGWILAVAWHSEYRSLILGTAMGVPLIIAISLFFYLRPLWKKNEFLNVSRELWKQDWETLQEGLKVDNN